MPKSFKIVLWLAPKEEEEEEEEEVRGGRVASAPDHMEMPKKKKGDRDTLYRTSHLMYAVITHTKGKASSIFVTIKKT